MKTAIRAERVAKRNVNVEHIGFVRGIWRDDFGAKVKDKISRECDIHRIVSVF